MPPVLSGSDSHINFQDIHTFTSGLEFKILGPTITQRNIYKCTIHSIVLRNYSLNTIVALSSWSSNIVRCVTKIPISCRPEYLFDPILNLCFAIFVSSIPWDGCRPFITDQCVDPFECSWSPPWRWLGQVYLRIRLRILIHMTIDALIHPADHGLCTGNDPWVREDSKYLQSVDSEAVQLSIYESLAAGVPPTYSLLSPTILTICLALTLSLPLPFQEILWARGP